MNAIVAANGGRLSSLIHDRDVSCREVMVAYLDRIDAVNKVRLLDTNHGSVHR